jgi:hypothetical protein
MTHEEDYRPARPDIDDYSNDTLAIEVQEIRHEYFDTGSKQDKVLKELVVRLGRLSRFEQLVRDIAEKVRVI